MVIQSVSAVRLLREARRAIAEVAGRNIDSIDASLAARTSAERAQWLDELSAGRPEINVAAWVLITFATRRPLDMTTAPLPLQDVAAALIALAGPLAILVATPLSPPTADALLASIRLAATLAARFTRLPVCLAAPRPALDEVLASVAESVSIAMARQGLIDVVADREQSVAQPTGTDTVSGRSRAERCLHEALNRDARTRGRFALCTSLPVVFSERPAEVDLYDAELQLAVEIDGWYHFQDPESYRRDRRKELVLQRAGIFVMRFLEQDVWDRLHYLVDQVADAVTFRSTTHSAAHGPQRR
jgi:very-short-patch-repair endonuclease